MRRTAFVTLRSVLLCFAACLAHPAFARDGKDVLVMKNGDRLTCEVKTLDAGVLHVKLDYVEGTVSIDWLQVARLEGGGLFLVQLKDGTLYSGKVVSPETLPATAGKLKIEVPEQEPVLVERSEVVRMTQTSDNFLKRFSGNITLGALYSKGNTTTQYNISSDVGYQQTRWGGRATYGSNLSSGAGAGVSTRNQLDVVAYRLLPWKNYFYAGTAGFLQSSVQGIQRQVNLGFGLGRFLKNTNRARWSVFGGLGWQGTRYVSAAEAE